MDAWEFDEGRSPVLGEFSVSRWEEFEIREGFWDIGHEPTEKSPYVECVLFLSPAWSSLVEPQIDEEILEGEEGRHK
jgi:hypothetical protein